MNTTSLEHQITNLLHNEDKSALNLLYANYADSLYGVILKVTIDEKIAEDALQETFIKVWKNGHKFDPKKAKLFTWLYRIARNTAIDKLRSYSKKQQKNIRLDQSNVYITPSKGINEEVIDLQNHVDKLDEKYKIVIDAIYFEGLTHTEASEALDIPLGTIKSRLKIGLRELKKVYNP